MCGYTYVILGNLINKNILNNERNYVFPVYFDENALDIVHVNEIL